VKKLFSRKEKNTGVQGKAKPAGRGGLSLARLNLVPMLVSVVVVLATGYLAYMQFAEQFTEQQKERKAAVARELAAELAGRLQAMGDELSRMAQADPSLLAAIAKNDVAILRQREVALASAYPGLLRARYVLPSEQDPNDSLAPRLGYACLDLARQAEAGKVPPFEVHQFGGVQQHLDMVRPVLDGKASVASLMLTLDVSVLKHWLEAIKPQQGYVELLQGRGDKPLPLFGVGDTSLKGMGEAYLADVAQSSWQLGYRQSGALALTNAKSVGFLATFAVAGVILLGFFLFFNLFISRLLKNDLKHLVGFIIDSSLGKRFHSYPVRLAESKSVLQEKEMELSVLSSHASVKSPSSRTATPIEDDSIPDLTFVSGDGISVSESEDESARSAGEEKAKQDEQ